MTNTLTQHPAPPRPIDRGDAIEHNGHTLYWVESRADRDAIAGRFTPEELGQVQFIGEKGTL